MNTLKNFLKKQGGIQPNDADGVNMGLARGITPDHKAFPRPTPTPTPAPVVPKKPVVYPDDADGVNMGAFSKAGSALELYKKATDVYRGPWDGFRLDSHIPNGGAGGARHYVLNDAPGARAHFDRNSYKYSGGILGGLLGGGLGFALGGVDGAVKGGLLGSGLGLASGTVGDLSNKVRFSNMNKGAVGALDALRMKQLAEASRGRFQGTPASEIKFR
jgi:hypothetical protein